MNFLLPRQREENWRETPFQKIYAVRTGKRSKRLSTNKQLKLYLRQQGVKPSENKAQLIERVLNMYADGAFEAERLYEEDDKSMSEETEGEEEDRRTCLKVN